MDYEASPSTSPSGGLGRRAACVNRHHRWDESGVAEARCAREYHSRHLEAGVIWNEEITKALCSCHAAVILFSRQAIESLWAVTVGPVSIDDEKAMMEILATSDVVFILATEGLLQETARGLTWLDTLYERANEGNLFTLSIGHGVRERWEQVSPERRSTEDFIHLDESSLFATNVPQGEEPPLESGLPPVRDGVSLEYLDRVLSVPIKQYANLLLDADTIMDRLQRGESGLTA